MKKIELDKIIKLEQLLLDIWRIYDILIFDWTEFDKAKLKYKKCNIFNLLSEITNDNRVQLELYQILLDSVFDGQERILNDITNKISKLGYEIAEFKKVEEE